MTDEPNKQPATTNAAESGIGSTELLAKIFDLDKYDICEFDYTSYGMTIQSNGEYVRLEDVVNIVRSFNG